MCAQAGNSRGWPPLEEIVIKRVRFWLLSK
jgi:hypothetical protein